MTAVDLVPRAVRRPVLGVVAVAAVAFTVMAARFAGTSEAGGVDRRVDAVVDPIDDAHVRVFHRIAVLGSPLAVVTLAFLLAGVCLALSRYRLAALAIVGPGVTGVCTTLLKPTLGRTIDGAFAFPSGHTGGATSLGLVAALLLLCLLRPGRSGWLAVLAAGAVVVGGGVGAALVATNAHYPTDTIGGFCTAVVVVLGGALVFDRVAAVRDRRRRGGVSG